LGETNVNLDISLDLRYFMISKKKAIISNRTYVILILINFVLNYMSIFSLYSYV